MVVIALPFQGGIVIEALKPRALPWAVMRCPFGANSFLEDFTFPLAYEYYRLVLHFYTNGGNCICVNARSGSAECWAELEMEDEKVVSVTIHRTPLRACLPPAYLDKFKKVLGACSPGIYNKWKRFFLHDEIIECEEFDFRISDPPTIAVIDETTTETSTQTIISIQSTKMSEDRAVFTFSDGNVSAVNFKPFFETVKHPAVKECYEKDGLSNWVLESPYIDSLGWPEYLICFPLHDLYEGRID